MFGFHVNYPRCMQKCGAREILHMPSDPASFNCSLLQVMQKDLSTKWNTQKTKERKEAISQLIQRLPWKQMVQLPSSVLLWPPQTCIDMHCCLRSHQSTDVVGISEKFSWKLPVKACKSKRNKQTSDIQKDQLVVDKTCSRVHIAKSRLDLVLIYIYI